MSTSKIIKLAGAIKPPARKSEIIEALAIKKRTQIIEENKKLRQERDQIKAKIQVVAREEASTKAVMKKDQRFSCYTSTDAAGRVTVDTIKAAYEFEASPELRAMIKRERELDRMGLHHEPSLHEVRQQVRAKVLEQTPPDGRIQELLKNPMLESLLDKLDGKPSQALIA